MDSLDPFATKSKVKNNSNNIPTTIPSTPPRNEKLEQTCFETPGLKESDLSNQMDGLSIVKDDDSQLIKDTVTPLKTHNSLKITASNTEGVTFTPEPKNKENTTKMDSLFNHKNTSNNSSSSTLQNSGLLKNNNNNSSSKYNNNTSSSLSSGLNPDDINAELLNLLVRCVTNQQIDNEIYKHLREREKEQREVSTQEAAERSEIEEFTNQLKTRYQRLKDAQNSQKRRREYTAVEIEVSSQRDRNIKCNESLEAMNKKFVLEKIEWAKKLKESEGKNSLLEGQQRIDKMKINKLETELSHSKQQVNALKEQNKGLEQICEEMLNGQM